MKFTKEQAFEKLKGILTENGKKPLRMTEISINRQLDALMPILASEETELDDFVEKSKESFSTMNSNAEYDNSKFAKSFEQEFKEKWEKEHQTTPPITPPTNGGGSENELMKQMQEELRQLKEDNAKSKAEKEIIGKRSELVSKLKEKKIEDEKWIDAYIKKLPINADTDVETEANDALAFYNISNSHVGSGVTPQGGGSSASVDENEFSRIKKERESRIEQRSKL